MREFIAKDIRVLLNLFRMQIRDRYLGSILGIYWAAVNPLLLLGVYTFVFGFIFKSKIPGSEKSLDYVIWLISGLAPWFCINEGINSSTNSVHSNANIVKNIVFKTEALPLASALMGFIPLIVSMLFLLILMIFAGTTFSFNIFFLIPVIVLQFMFIAGVGLFTSAITVFIRDIGQLITTLLLMCMFFSPIFYPIKLMPLIIQKITFFNPFHQIIDGYRCALIYNKMPDLKGLGYLLCLNIILWFIGLKFFRRLKGYFELVL